LIISASRNPLFNMLCGAFEAVIISTWPLGWRARGSNEGRMPSIHAHMDVAQAIMNHDTAGVDAAMSRHFDETMRVLVDAGIA
jgi:DNA-binding FadR family transcriptional regulator